MNSKEMEENLNTLRCFLRMSHKAESVLNLFEALPEAQRYRGEGSENFVYVPPTRENAVLLVAHADVCVESAETPDLIEDGDVIRNANGILGADDRAGCAMLWLLQASGHGLLITDGEEDGLVGSEFLRCGLFRRGFPQALPRRVCGKTIHRRVRRHMPRRE